MPHSNLSLSLLELFGQGELSAICVQQIAKAAWDDGWGRECVMASKLWQICTCGKFPQNALRDLLTVVKASPICEVYPEPYMIDVRCKGNSTNTVPCYLPHEYLAKYEEPIDNLCVRSDNIDSSYLGKTLLTWSQHPDVVLPRDAVARVVPIGVHADGVQYYSSSRAGTARSLFGISWNMIAAPEKVRAKKKDQICKFRL